MRREILRSNGSLQQQLERRRRWNLSGSVWQVRDRESLDSCWLLAISEMCIGEAGKQFGRKKMNPCWAYVSLGDIKVEMTSIFLDGSICDSRDI